MKTTILALLLGVALTSGAQDSIPADTIEVPYTKYLIVSIDDFFDLNADISQAKNYQLGQSTERVLPLDISLFTIVDKNPNKGELMAVSPINPENQAYVDTSLLVEFNDIVFIDTALLEYDIKIKNKNKNWVKVHWNKVGPKEKKLKVEDK